ncbi:MAG TPA: GNAT family N-acetyltransferase [Beijerinckiaceae bacterium]|jgi:GNAT superfamily N-acetyltransferase
MPDFALALATLDDAPEVAWLIRALDVHYLGEERAPSDEAARAMVERCLREREGTRFLLARQGGMPVGIACFTIVRPGHQLGGVLFLKDLFVVTSARGGGIGRALLAGLANHARDHGTTRIDLTTEPGNAGARKLYERLGARQIEKVFYRFGPEALAALSEDGP